MAFSNGDCVKARINLPARDGTKIPKGSRGEVVRSMPSLNLYLVEFQVNGQPKEAAAFEASLEPC